MNEEIRMYVQNYDKCQCMNYNFTKSNAKLQSVTIQTEVWRQVSSTPNMQVGVDLIGPVFL